MANTATATATAAAITLFEDCAETYGYLAVMIAALAYGSCGVPVKATQHLAVPPIVVQSYHTIVVVVRAGLVVVGWGMEEIS